MENKESLLSELQLSESEIKIYDESTMYKDNEVEELLAPGILCPQCRDGVLEEEYTMLGILLAVCLFPVGMICCFMLREYECSECGSRFKNSWFR